MNISSNARDALRAVANESADNKIHRCRKVIIDLEKNPEEASHRVCGDLRKVLTSVKESPESFAEQVAQAGALLLRVRDIDPRRLKRIAEDEVEDEVTDETEIVAGTSASDVSKSLPLTIDGIHQVIRKFAGALPCDAPLDVTTLSVGKQNHIIEELVHKTERCLSVPDIQLVIDELKPSASSFPGLIQVAQRYLETTRNLLAMLNSRRAGVTPL